MRVHHNVCCGIDVHKKSVTACLMWGPADREPEFEIRRFGTMTRDLRKLAEWLKQSIDIRFRSRGDRAWCYAFLRMCCH